MDMAAEAGLDLVEISPNANPPVCKIMDFGKFKYEQQKRESEARKKQKTIDVKEVKFRPNTDTHDYDVKMRNVLRFLEGGDKVKVTVRFRGREMAHQDEEIYPSWEFRLCQLVLQATDEYNGHPELQVIPANPQTYLFLPP